MRALVSGGSSGIGASTCLRLAEAALARGAQPMIAVCGLGVSASQEQVAASIQSMGGTAVTLVGDLRDPEVPSQLVAAAVAEFGGLDGLIANAGIARPGAICDLSLEDWDDMFSVNLRGAWLLAKASYPYLRDSRGSACFTSSMSGQLPHAGSGAYSPSKAALTMLAQTLALEWAPDGIRVNVVSPGMTHTPMTEKMYVDPQIKDAREHITPLSRIADPMDIANMIEFLVGPLSGYVTGQDICVDGGFSKSILSHIPGRPSSNS
jgi:glucose 1-dehydrogenase